MVVQTGFLPGCCQHLRQRQIIDKVLERNNCSPQHIGSSLVVNREVQISAGQPQGFPGVDPFVNLSIEPLPRFLP